MELLTHDIVVLLATLFSILPDHFSVALFGGELWLHGDGSFITGRDLSAHLYGRE